MADRKKTDTELRAIRERIYAMQVYKSRVLSKHVALQQLLRGRRGEVFHVPKKGTRPANFKSLVENNFVLDEFAPGGWPKEKSNIPAYKNLKAYSETDYGAAMIHRILMDNKLRKEGDRFKIQYDDGKKGEFARANYNFVLYSRNFGTGRHPGGELRYPLSYTHHEFAHTRFYTYRKKISEKFPIQEEQSATLLNSNPVRIYAGYEPRYTYTTINETINVLTGEVRAGVAWTIKEDDPRVLKPIGAKEARKW